MEKNKFENFPEEISKKYEIIQEIGRGAFSIVYKVKSKEDNNIYCLKKINMKKTKDKENEIKILSNLDHPNLIKFFYSFSNEDGIYIIMEFCEYGDLFSLLQSVKKKKVYVNEEIIWNVAIQTLLGLEYLHSKNIIHRDIKLLNLFMTKDKKIKIGDMGMSKYVEEGEMIISRVGTPLYIAPELVKKEKYDYKIDIWSFGCSLYHLAKTSPPFNDENLIKLGNSIINEQPASLPSCYSKKLYDFILLLMTKNKNKRPSATEALKLVPEKIKNHLNKKYIEKNNNIEKENIYENKKIIENECVSNNKINDSKDENASINDINAFSPKPGKDFYINKNNNKFNLTKGLISGQTFYHFFKNNNNNEKRKSNLYFGNSNESNNNKNKINDQKYYYNIINNQNLLLSKTMLQMKENYKRKTTPENIDINKINSNYNNIKLVSNNFGKVNKKNVMKNLEKEIIKEYISNEKDININEENKNINMKESEYKNFIKKNDNDINKAIENNSQNNISLSFNKNEIINKYFGQQNLKGEEFNNNSKNNKESMKTFIVEENKENIKKLIYSMQLNNKRKNIINNSFLKKNTYKIENFNFNNKNRELIFPLIIKPDKRIQNKLKYQNNSITSKQRKYPELNNNNFRKTVNSNNFRNKLTIHDLK